MTISIFSRRMPAWTALAASTASCLLAAPAYSQSSEKTLAPVIVTGSRFASDPAFSPVGATIITAEEIRAAGINNVNEAIRKIGGVVGRQSLYGTQDYSLDLRGFGSFSDQNMVVLVDGIRLSENEQANAVMSAVPIELVERIEIVRGGSSVLYGEGATGGVIHIITKRSPVNGTRGSLVAEFGSFDHRDFRASVAKGWEGFSLDANVGRLRADNYRDNNEIKHDIFSVGAQWGDSDGRFGLRVDASKLDNRFPGPLTLSEFQENPRQTKTSADFGTTEMERYTAFIEKRIASVDLAAELSRKERKVKSFMFGSMATYDGHVTQFSPRLRYSSVISKYENHLILGLDFSHWERQSNNIFSNADASQKAQAFYVRNEIKSSDVRIALGARTEKFKKNMNDSRAMFGSNEYAKEQTLHAWDVHGVYDLTRNLNIFAKAGRSYRVANVDDNALTSTFNQPLEPQISRDLEIGATFGNNPYKLTVRAFQQRSINEIFFDPTVFTNTNLDPTKRKGIEIEARVQLASAYTLSAFAQHVSAKFSGGPNNGNEMVLVPENTAALRLNWLPGTGHTANVGMQWVDSQRYGDDFSNACSSRVPSYTTVDARYAVSSGPWEFAITGNNLTNRDYFSNGFYGPCSGFRGIYPDPGRQIKISARMDF